MWRGKPNHCFIVSVTMADGAELFLTIARDEADAEQTLSRRYSAKAGERVKCQAQCSDEITRICGIDLKQHGSFAALDLVWLKAN